MRRSGILALLALAFLSGSALLSAPATRPAKEYTIEQFMQTTTISGASFTADEKRLLFSSNKSGIINVHAVAVAGGAPAALTDSTVDSTYLVSAFPHDERFLYTHDQGGNENNHLFVRTPGQAEKDLTPGDKLKAVFVDWTHDGSGFYVQTNERDARFFDLYRYDAKTYGRRLVFQDDTGYEVGAISDDGRWLASEEDELDRRQRSISLERGDEGGQAPVQARGNRGLRAGDLRPGVEVAVFPDQRRLRVHACRALRARHGTERGRREGGLGRRVDLLLPQREVPRLRPEPGRPLRAPRVRREDRARRWRCRTFRPVRSPRSASRAAKRSSPLSSTAIAVPATSTSTSSARRPRSA